MPLKTVIAFIPARAGSKGLPGKNIIDLAGKPLIGYTIDAALHCDMINHVVVSTDGEDIARVAKACGANVEMRPDELASDTALPKDALRYHLSQMDTLPDVIVLLQPTSPLRIVDDIAACLTPVLSGEADSAATFVASTQSPYREWTCAKDGSVSPAIPDHDPWRPRQALPQTYRLNGAVYAVRTDLFLSDNSHSFLPGRNRMVLMPDERSIDIDVRDDLDRAANLLNV